jgi:hypothetical protein
MQATLIRSNGEMSNVDGDDSLETVQQLVGGYVEVVTNADITFFVNEEGRLRGLAPNLKATLFAGQQLVGDVVAAKTATLGPGWRTTRFP